jgi:hypothetical protein
MTIQQSGSSAQVLDPISFESFIQALLIALVMFRADPDCLPSTIRKVNGAVLG